MSVSHYIGIDVGSGSVKAMLVDSEGVPIQTFSAEYETRYPRPGFVEQDPKDWYVAAGIAVRSVVRASGIAADSVTGVGLSGTSHVPSLLDRNLSLVRPAILWNDQRSEDQVRRLADQSGELITRRTRNTINCTWSLPQIAWVKENEPDAFDRVRHVLFSKDYLVYMLTGELVADYSSAYSSLFVSADTLDWDPDLASLVDLDTKAFPTIHKPTDVVGTLTAQAAGDLGLSENTRVVVGVLDSAAEFVGVGALDPSVGVIRLGTAGGVMTIVPGPEWREGCLLYPHPTKPYWYHQAGTNSATTSLAWAREVFGLDDQNWSYEELDGLAEEAQPGCDGLVFHPYLLGERAPYWSRAIRGGFSGATINHGRAAFYRAILEGVAYSLRDCTTLVDWSRTREVRICGGGVRSLLWCRIIADVVGLPVNRVRETDASALGAALLAIAGCEGKELVGITTGRSSIAHQQRIEPNVNNHRVYEDNYSYYREIAGQYLRIYSESGHTALP